MAGYLLRAFVILCLSAVLFVCCAPIVAAAAKTGPLRVTVTVDNVNGTDNPECVSGTGSSQCKTLDYTFSRLLTSVDCRDRPLINVLIHKGDYDYSLNASNTSYQFRDCMELAITGAAGDDGWTTIQCTGGGFAFFNSKSVKISNITFQFCQSWQNSTSFNSTTNAMSFVNAALYFAFCENVYFNGVTVEGTNGVGVVMYNTHGTLEVIKSCFTGNHNGSRGSGGGFYAEFCYCDPGLTDNCIQHDNTDAHLVFSGSRFVNNTNFVKSEQTNTFIYANGTTNVGFGRGGGLTLIFKGSASNINVTIEHCNISFNKATWGGGLFVEFQDTAYNNTVVVGHTSISDNICELRYQQSHGTGGGGARVGFIFFSPKTVQNNMIRFEMCSFSNNSAYWGGGVSYYTPPESGIIEATNKLTFYNCTWISNYAALGSAVDLSVWHPNKTGVLSTIEFIQCQFDENSNNPNIGQTFTIESSLGTGALYSDSVPLAFLGTVLFQNNIGSALALFATSATFGKSCQSNFTNNYGWTGGAIALLGNAWLEIYDETVFLFHNNTAILKGGAIFVEISSRHDLLSSRNCFLQYYSQFAHPNEWNTSFSFESNCAPTGPAIFATSLASCVWGSADGTVYNVNISYFHFIAGYANFTDQIASEIADITVNVKPSAPDHPCSTNETSNSVWKVIPGKRYTLPMTFTDDINQPINRSLWLKIHSKSNVTVRYNLTADNAVIFLGEKNACFTLQVVTNTDRIVSTSLFAQLLPCPLGYVHDSDSHSCVCAYGKTSSWDGILNCDDSVFRAKIHRDYWAEHLDGHFYTGQCPKSYCATPSNSILPANNISDTICHPKHRRGILCGDCLRGYCVAINKPGFVCTNKIHSTSWLIYLSTEYLPSTFLFAIILFFDINLHSGLMGSIVLFFQVYSYLNIYSDGRMNSPDGSKNINKAIHFMYNIWNLDFFGIWHPPYCLARGFNAMQVLVVDYATGFYPFLLIFLVFILGRFGFGKLLGQGRIAIAWRKCKNRLKRVKWRLSLKASIITGLATFWTLAYTKLALISGYILSLEYINGQQDHPKLSKPVVSIQGNLTYFGQHHLPYAIPALLVLIFFVIVPSLAMFSYPLVPQLLGKIKKHVNLDNYHAYQVVSGKLEAPFIYFKPLLDNFQGKFKPRCEYFAGLLFWYRLAIFLTYSFASKENFYYINCATCLAFIFVIALAQPYQKARNNTILLLTVMNITLINLISMYNYNEKVPGILLWIQILLVLCPMVLFAGYLSIKIGMKLYAYYKGTVPDGLYINLPPTEDQEELDFPAREILQNLAEED